MLCFGRLCASPCALNVSAALQGAYRLGFVGAEIVTNFWCFVHNFGYGYATMSFKGSKDADFGLVSENVLSHNNGSIGWGPGPGKCSQKHPHWWRSPRKLPIKNEIFFFDSTTRLAESVEGLNSSLA